MVFISTIDETEESTDIVVLGGELTEGLREEHGWRWPEAHSRKKHQKVLL
jgi:hypothetical protein